jgi:hypothetical protein
MPLVYSLSTFLRYFSKSKSKSKSKVFIATAVNKYIILLYNKINMDPPFIYFGGNTLSQHNRNYTIIGHKMDVRVDEGDFNIRLIDWFIRRGVGSAGEGNKCSCINPGPTTFSS